MHGRLIRMSCLALLLAALAGSLMAKQGLDQETGVIYSAHWGNGVPLGGVGCGKFDLLTDGNFANFTINHNWDRPTGILKGCFAAIYTDTGKAKQARLLRLGGQGEYGNVRNIEQTEYLGKLPTVSLKYLDQGLPVEVELLGFSPLIPHDIKNSSLPVALLSFKVKNKTAAPLDASLLLSWQNILGFGGDSGIEWENYAGNTQARTDSARLTGLLFKTTQHYADRQQNTVGQYFIGAPKSKAISTCEMWDAAAPAVSFWDGFAKTGNLSSPAAAPTGGEAFRPAGAMAVPVRLKAGQEKTVQFVVVWYMPEMITIFGDKEIRPTKHVYDSDRDVERPFDGDPGTNWNTGRPQRPGDTFTMDFGAPKQVARLVFESKDKIWDYPRAFRVETSADKKAWTTALTRTEAQDEKDVKEGVLSVTMKPVTARYMRIVQTSDGWPGGWTMNELYIYSDEAGKTARIKPVWAQSTTRLYRDEIVKVKHREDVSHYYKNFFKDAPSIADYCAKNAAKLLAQAVQTQDLVWQSNLPFWLKLKLVNCAFPVICNTIFTKDGRFTCQESPQDMAGSLGTMDQRLSAHAVYTTLFTELDMREVELFTKCQSMVDIVLDEKPVKNDGQISHFTGNLHEWVGSPNVGGGITQWPDLTCSWVMQSLKLYRWTGDRKFLDRQWGPVQRGMQWLTTRDTDGDLIPEGGSTYDYEPHGAGAFAYTASVYLGALKAAGEMARVEGDTKMQKTYAERFEAVRANMMKELWNGKSFKKRFVPKTGQINPNCFIAQMAGDWMSELSGLGDTLPEDVRQSAVREVLGRNLLPFYPVPPMEVTPDGKTAVEPCYILQHEPYLGFQAINAGYVDDGLEVVKRIYDVAWLYNKTPWAQRLWIDTSTGKDHWGGTYMTSGATWHVMHALLGATVDLPGQTLFLSPRLASDRQEWHLPLFYSRFWAWVDYAPGKKELKVKILKTFGEGPMVITKVVGDQAKPAIALKKKFTIKAGATLDLSDKIDELVKYKQTNKATALFPEKRAPLPAQK